MSSVFRPEAIAARREQAGPGRLLGRERLGRLWLVLALAVAAGLALSLLVRVPAFAVGAARVDPGSGRVSGVVAGHVEAAYFRVTPAGRCATIQVSGGVQPAGPVTAVTGTLPPRCRGAGGIVHVAVPRGEEPLLQLAWERFR